MSKKPSNIDQSRYKALIEKIFFRRYKKGLTEIGFKRDELSLAAKELGIELPKNLGDIVYSIRYRTALPDKILATQPDRMEWIIEGTGRANYVFKLVRINRIVPNKELVAIKVPNATPEIITAYALSDEQALLAKIRYNRLLDIFLGIATYSLQNHLRTTVKGIGQIEIDEVYVGIDKFGRQFIIPVQAKGGADQLSVVQAKQDIACCKEKFGNLTCLSISAQFMDDDLIVLFELIPIGDEIKIVEERHYRLVPSDQISAEELRTYSNRT
jgi:hypothetical protein